MNKLEKYIEVALMGFIAIMLIPVLLFLSLFAFIGYIICKLFKLDINEFGNFEYE